MSTAIFGRLHFVDPRIAWASEAGDFTPWLAEDENLTLLGDTIGLELELDSTERYVGPYRADILCKDTATDTWVVIENQLERTDHSHLGQLLTYAAGLNAVTIVWIARHFTDEHRAALDWLNDITGTSINFFGLEVELWQIADSPVAPKFNMASKPNDWIKDIGAAKNVPLSVTQQWQFEYWTRFREYIEENSTIIKPRKPQPQYWMDFAIGRSEFSLETVVHDPKQELGVNLAITGPDAKPHYYLLEQDKEDIEAEIGAGNLLWWELPTKKSSYISLRLSDTDPTDKKDWPRQHEWMLATMEAFHRCFSPRVKALDAADYIPEPGEDEL